ncbi:nitroreductase family protein [Burkholderia oklahomensis]|uniref:nitroreductase family protein n=1 Tax=Burkholderia oklahomensis TaxID=342113 RepID=UPI0012F4EDF7|nr:nitroreductase family protein [Burkholderia oklahomensis]MBI0361031.1 nitroreductase family protein [Burkholderia oklahomensis]
MLRTDDPKPLGDGPYSDYIWPVDSSTQFEPLSAPARRTFVDVFEQRRSTRALSPAPLELTVGALLFALVPRFWKEGDVLRRSRRPTLSAGALHPISVLLFSESAVFRINADSCMLEKLAFTTEVRDAWVSKCRRVLPAANGAFITLVADMARPMSAYADSETLVWRDAGAMLQTLALVAELFGLGFCPLGILGSEVVSALPSGGQLLAAGAAAIGLPAQG